jgi:sugar-phosphatase
MDSTASVEGVWRRWASAKGLNAERILQISHGRRAVDVLAELLPDHEREKNILEQLELEALDSIEEIPGVQAVLQQLASGRWAVVTSGVREVAIARLHRMGLPLPRVLVAAEDVTRGKPDPEAYIKAARLLDVNPSDCLVFEDAPAGIASARASGARVIALTTTYPLAALDEAESCIANFLSVAAEVRGDVIEFAICPITR